MAELFFELIQVAIGTRDELSRIPSESEWEELYDMADKQSLIGICFAGLLKLGANVDDGYLKIGMSEELFFSWIGTAAAIQQKNKKMNKRCVELQKMLADAGFRSCILKGQGIAALYRSLTPSPSPKGEGSLGNSSNALNIISGSKPMDLSLLRQSGDIDAWVEGGVGAVITIVSKYEKIEKLDNKHLHLHCFPETEVELHWSPVLWYGSPKNKKLQAYFEEERQRQFCNQMVNLCIPTLDFQLVHQLLHVYGHYIYEGVGMRQVMDMYFSQLACSEIDGGYEKVIALFEKLGLMKFVAATQWVLMEVFLMPKDKCICEPDEKEGKKLLEEIMIGGNFGHHDERNNIKDEAFIQKFFRRWARKFRMFRFDPLGTLIMPLSRLQLEFWMRKVRRQYGV